MSALSNTFMKTQFQQALPTIIDNKKTLRANADGSFSSIGKRGKIWEIVRSWLGFENRLSLVEYRFLRLIDQGIENKWITPYDVGLITQAAQKIISTKEKNNKRDHREISKMVQAIGQSSISIGLLDKDDKLSQTSKVCIHSYEQQHFDELRSKPLLSRLWKKDSQFTVDDFEEQLKNLEVLSNKEGIFPAIGVTVPVQDLIIEEPQVASTIDLVEAPLEQTCKLDAIATFKKEHFEFLKTHFPIEVTQKEDLTEMFSLYLWAITDNPEGKIEEDPIEEDLIDNWISNNVLKSANEIRKQEKSMIAFFHDLERQVGKRNTFVLLCRCYQLFTQLNEYIQKDSKILQSVSLEKEIKEIYFHNLPFMVKKTVSIFESLLIEFMDKHPFDEQICSLDNLHFDKTVTEVKALQQRLNIWNWTKKIGIGAMALLTSYVGYKIFQNYIGPIETCTQQCPDLALAQGVCRNDFITNLTQCDPTTEVFAAINSWKSSFLQSTFFGLSEERLHYETLIDKDLFFSERISKGIFVGVLDHIPTVVLLSCLMKIPFIGKDSEKTSESYFFNENDSLKEYFLDYFETMAAPFYEELLFRGIIQNSLAYLGVSVIHRILLTNTIFALAHRPCIAQVANILLLPSNSILFETSGLTASIAHHFINNFIVSNIVLLLKIIEEVKAKKFG